MRNVRKLRPLNAARLALIRAGIDGRKRGAGGTSRVNYDQIFDQAIDRLPAEGRYRVFIDILRNQGMFPNARCFAGHNGPKRSLIRPSRPATRAAISASLFSP